MEMNEKTIKTLRLVFGVSTAAFNCQAAVIEALGKNHIPSYMEQLHKIAHEEINKESPDPEKITLLLEEMEMTTEGMKKEVK